MNLRHLELFLAIAEHGSVMAGAKALLLSQSAASQALAALEEETGSPLFERGRGGVKLTPAGLLFQRHARRILSDVRHALESLERHRGLERAEVRVAASSIPAAYLAPTLLAQMCLENPALSVTLAQGDSRETLDRVAGREADVGLVGSRFGERGLVYEALRGDEILLLARADSPWAARGPLPPDALLLLPLILRENGSGTTKTVAAALAGAGIDLDALPVRARLGSNEAVKSALLGGFGASFLSDLSVRRELASGELVVLPLQNLHLRRDFFLVRRADARLSPSARAFWALALAAYGPASPVSE